jgi:hypothetical protein
VSIELLNSPKSESHVLLDFDDIDIRPGFITNTFFLTVTGTKPCINMQVRLSPRIYVSCPDYWDIEVVGYLPGGVCLTAVAPYSETTELTGITGSKGIRVVGATKKEVREVSGGCKSGTNFK